MMARLHPLPCLLLATLLAACAGKPSTTPNELPRTPQVGIEQLLQEAATSEPQKAAFLRLQAADQSAQQGNRLQARQILDQVQLPLLNPAQQILASTLAAELALADNQVQQALEAIQHPSFQVLGETPVTQQVRSHLARAKTFAAGNQLMAAIRERIFLAPLLDGVAARDNHEAIWLLADALPSEQLQATGNRDLDGWLSLAAAVRQAGLLSAQQAAIDSWRQQHSDHPAALQLPEPLATLRELQDQPIQHVALLLPMQGQLANVSQALRDGFFAAHLQARQAGQGLQQIDLYDSTQYPSLDSFYAQAKTKGVQLVIGPLEKERVKQLSERKELPIPTLALNYSDTPHQTPPQLFQFGLAAEDEAREVARRAWADGRRRAIALVPQGEWGSRVLEAFRQSWQAQGGVLIAAEPLAEPAGLANQIAELLKLRESETRFRQLESTLGTPLNAQPSSRQDVDFLFLAAPPQQAQQVRPTLVFQYAGDVPVYATSHLHSASHDRRQYQDLEGIRFAETPWLLAPQNPLRQQVERQWPQAGGSLGRLYAMGADAYLLVPRLNQLQALPNTRLEGLSGSLSMSPQQRIERQLPWAEFREGSVIPLGSDNFQTQ